MAIITYKFLFLDKIEKIFVIDTNREDTSQQLKANDVPWTDLQFHQCQNCPLKASDYKKCPAAVDVQEITDSFKEVFSTEITQVLVETENRVYLKQCDTQTALSALIGLMMATSACPILRSFIGMAHYHLPFATFEETIMRSVSNYLLKQYFLYKDGKKPDWELRNFIKLYESVELVNRYFFERIKAASRADANLNAIIIFFSLSMIVSGGIDDYLEDLKHQMQ